jgi:outer membrane protein OmpA-like peptidoglycan-associated protein
MPAVPAPAPAIKAPVPPPPGPPVAQPPVAIGFPAGSSALPLSSMNPLGAVAGSRGDGLIIVVGYGEAETPDPQAQARGLQLGLARAEAMANVLARDGVPATAMQISALAAGRGGAIRLIK